MGFLLSLSSNLAKKYKGQRFILLFLDYDYICVPGSTSRSPIILGVLLLLDVGINSWLTYKETTPVSIVLL